MKTLCALAVAGVALSYIVGRSLSAAGLFWLPLPLLGFFRADVAAAFFVAEALLLASAVSIARCCRCCRSTGSLSLATLLILICAALFQIAELPHWHFRIDVFQQIRELKSQVPRGKVEEVLGALSSELCDQLAARVFEKRDLWTHITDALAIPNFVFGKSINFDQDLSPTTFSEKWTLHFGFRNWLGEETAYARDSSRRSRRKLVQQELEELPGFLPGVRSAIAKYLQIEEVHVKFGQDGSLRGNNIIGYPSFQIWLPNIIWRCIVNTHDDILLLNEVLDLLERHVGVRCDEQSATTFLFAVSEPPRAGLLHYSFNPELDDGEEQVTPYRKGSMYVFPSKLWHAINPWDFNDLLLQPRITIQSFAANCSGTWYVYH
eukprot:TRINITY_DN95945_c0_g1_i1.p1 TRINITY_DN95945_c0_g1~~TRINITY_DN95945_c0_g1_i1.p1  ORF type:complete len:377 (-),score=54.31 TRINITY_DN95945_c0_g1_i1:136-1266(-)